jgi:hypothetical protein
VIGKQCYGFSATVNCILGIPVEQVGNEEEKLVLKIRGK